MSLNKLWNVYYSFVSTKKKMKYFFIKNEIMFNYRTNSIQLVCKFERKYNN